VVWDAEINPWRKWLKTSREFFQAVVGELVNCKFSLFVFPSRMDTCGDAANGESVRISIPLGAHIKKAFPKGTLFYFRGRGFTPQQLRQSPGGA
jgi:hypothetical protein